MHFTDIGNYVINLDQIVFVHQLGDGKGIDVHFVDGSQVHFDDPDATSLLSILQR